MKPSISLRFYCNFEPFFFFINLFYTFELKERKIVTETVVQDILKDMYRKSEQLTIPQNKLPWN